MSESTENLDEKITDYVAFPNGDFRTLAEIKMDQPVSYIKMKTQFLTDIGKLKHLTQRLISNEFDDQIDTFHTKIAEDLKSDDKKPHSLISFKDTRYYLHKIITRTERFLELEAKNPDDADKLSLNRDSFCTLFHEILSGIDYCLGGNGTRLQSGFTSIENSRDPQKVLLQIRHGLLDYGIKLFLINERANDKDIFRLGNEVHTHSELYNLVCKQFGLEPLKDFGHNVNLNDKIEMINRLELILPSLMPEFDILNKLTDVFYQDLVSSLKKRNKEHWLTRPVFISELKDEIIDGIKEDFITPINLRFKTNNKNRLGLWTIIKSCSDGSYEFSESRERFQVWLIDNYLNHTPAANVLTMVGKKNKAHSSRFFSKKNRDNTPLFYIGSKDNLYFWVFKSETPLIQYANCNLEWNNHQTLTLSHLTTADFYSLPNEVRFNLFQFALNNSNKSSDFFEFFFNKIAAEKWDKMVESAPEIKEIMFEKFTKIMNDDKAVLRGLTDYLPHLPKESLKEYASNFFTDLLHRAFKLQQVGVIDFLLTHGLHNSSTRFIKAEFQKVLFSTLQSDSEKFKILCKHPVIDFNSKNEQGQTLLMIAAKYGKTEQLKLFLAKKGSKVNVQDMNGYTALSLAAANGQMECLTLLLTRDDIKLNLESNDGWTALKLAAKHGRTDCLKMLLKQQKINVDLRFKNSWTPLMAAARCGHGDCVKALLDHDASSINEQNREGYTALMLAVIKGDERCVSLLFQLSDSGINTTNTNDNTAWVHLRNIFGVTLAMLAAKYGNIYCLKAILEKKIIDVDEVENNGKTALMLAAAFGQTECLELLLAQEGIDVNKQKNNLKTALIMAAKRGRTKCLKILLAHQKIDVNCRARHGVTALMLAAQLGHTQSLIALLKHKDIKVNARDIRGWTALMYAARNGKTDCLLALLKKQGIDANLPDINGWTPLMSAARNGHGDWVEALLVHDPSSINARNKDGATALMMAADGGDERCAMLLLKQPNIDINTTDKYGKTAWQCAQSNNVAECQPWQQFQRILDAVISGNLTSLTELLNFAGALIHVRNKQGLTLAMVAAKNGQIDCLKAILAMNVINVNERDKTGTTALMHAAEYGQTNCLEELLREEKIDPNAQSNTGWTALMHAARNGKTDCLLALLKKQGIDANLPDIDGWTPLMSAARYGHGDCVEALLVHDPSSINTQKNHGYTALMLAVFAGESGCIRCLLSHPDIKIDSKVLDLAKQKNDSESYQLMVNHKPESS
ncbi:ankyrin repeat domain-containing protein [Endozoicomonas sp. GU-1]|uniref:ankyrin repeat domain-containing protein n=1 Tax=Endozoicomonas sp. GU-1 TaxID=3009078 RepID=UPI0022B55125|nr:ankyrin repeat domain-containing protein [Endozoicomonas sp. GU-1]WBA83425.1 ankyrin repeat domain-containing protein [Endozoicomonas sp. GU-1]WBA86356.1 ankyrin repeat domain-containing protein [Endozoicomonas sp. GU-1]